MLTKPKIHSSIATVTVQVGKEPPLYATEWPVHSKFHRRA